MLGKIVRDENGRSYTISEKIASSGDTAEVWKATNNETQDAVAVKIARPGRDTNLFEDEYSVLQAIRDNSETANNVVWVIQETVEGRAALVMELMPQKMEMFQQSLDEAAMLKLAQQYVKLLNVVHTKLRRTCNDRKVGDLYWYPDQERLVVIDWNTTRHYPPTNAPGDTNEQEQQQQTNPDKQFEDEQRTDMSMFAGFWYEQLVTGKKANIPSPDDISSATPPNWQSLHRGTRRLITAGRADSAGYTTAQEWLTEIKWFQEWYTKNDVTTILTEADKLASNAKSWHDWERVCDLADLGHQRATLQKDKERMHEIQERAKKAIADQRDIFRQTIRQVKESIADGRPKASKEKLEIQLQRKDLFPTQRMQLQRWLVLSTALLDCERNLISTTPDMRQSMIGTVEKLDEAATMDRDGRVEQLRAVHATLNPQSDIWNQHATIIPYLELFDQEALLHLWIDYAWMKFQYAEQQKQGQNLNRAAVIQSLEAANKSYETANGILTSLKENQSVYRQQYREYAEALSIIVLDLHPDGSWHAVPRALKHQRILGDIEQTLQQVIQHIDSQWEKDGFDAIQVWPSRKWENELLQAEALEPEQMGLLKTIHTAVGNNSIPKALRAMLQMNNNFPAQSPTALVKDAITKIASHQIRNNYQQMRFPEEVKQGLEIIDLLEELDVFTDESWKSYKQKWQEHLQTKLQQQQDLRTLLGAPPDPLHNLDDSNLDAKLQEAQQQIEIFGRDKQEVLSIEQLLRKREEHRLKQNVAQSEVDLQDLSRRVNEIMQCITDLNKKIGDIGPIPTPQPSPLPQEIGSQLTQLQQRINQLEQRLEDNKEPDIDKPDEHTAEEEKYKLVPFPELMLQYDELEDIPGTLDKKMGILSYLDKNRQDLNEELSRKLDDRIDQGKLRYKLYLNVKEWHKYNNNNKEDRPPPHTLLGKTTEILSPDIIRIPKVYWEEIPQFVKKSYDVHLNHPEANFKHKNYAKNLVWLGLLHFRSQALRMNSFPNEELKEKDKGQLISNIVSILKKQLSGSSNQGKSKTFKEKGTFETYLKKVAESNANLEQVAEQVSQQMVLPSPPGGKGRSSYMLVVLILVVIVAVTGNSVWTGFLQTQQDDLVSAPFTMNIVASKTQLSADNRDTSQITIEVLNFSGEPVPDGTEVTLRVEPEEAGDIEEQSATTHDGKITVDFTAGDEPVAEARIIAQTDNRLEKPVSLSLIGIPDLEVVMQDWPEEKKSVVPGEVLTSSLSLENTGTAPLENARLIITAPDEMLLHQDIPVPMALDVIPVGEQVTIPLTIFVTREVSSGDLRGDLEYRIEQEMQTLVEESQVLDLVVQEPVAETIELNIAPQELQADGTSEATFTAHVYDQAGNPVPDGTEVAFTLRLQGNGPPRTEGLELISQEMPSEIVTPTALLKMNEPVTRTISIADSEVMKAETSEGIASITTIVGMLPVALEVTAEVIAAQGQSRTASEVLTLQPCGQGNIAGEQSPLVLDRDEGEHPIARLISDTTVSTLCVTPENPGRKMVFLVVGQNEFLLGWIEIAVLTEL